MIATTVVVLATAGMPSNTATPMRRLTAAPMAACEQLADTTRVSQMRVGAIAWYWYPVGVAPAVALPNQPFASMIMLMVPAALYTHIDVSSPPLNAGPSATI